MRRLTMTLIAMALAARAASAGDFDHTKLDELLARYGKSGLMHYGRLIGERQGLDEAAQALNLIDPTAIDEGDARKAFWLNTYNLLVIRSIVDAQPISRVTDVRGFYEDPRHPVGGDKVSLDRILDEHLRKGFGDPRVLFAVVPGSLSGPGFPEKAYRAEGLDAALDARVKAFLEREDTVIVDEAGRVIHVSPLFEQYAEDFVPADRPGEKEESWRKFLIQHGPARVRAALEESTPYRVQADLPEDWTINDRLVAKKKRFSWPWAGVKPAPASTATTAP